MTPEEAEKLRNLTWNPVSQSYYDSVLGVYWQPRHTTRDVWEARYANSLARKADASQQLVNALRLERDVEAQRYKEYGMSEREIDDKLAGLDARIATAAEAVSGADVGYYEGTEVDEPKPPKRIPNRQRGNMVYRVTVDAEGNEVETPYYEVPRAESTAAGRYDTPVDIARQKLAELAEQRRADEFKITQDFNVAKAAAEQSLARDRLKWDEANALGRREADVYGNLLTSFSQMSPYAVPPGTEYTPGFGPGGPAQYLSGKMNLPYNPEDYRTVMKYSPEDIWAMSSQLTGKRGV